MQEGNHPSTQANTNLDTTVGRQFDPNHSFSINYLNSSDAVFLVDPANDKVLEANPRACELIGYSRRDILARPFSSFHTNAGPPILDLPPEHPGTESLIVYILRGIAEDDHTQIALKNQNTDLEQPHTRRSEQLEHSLEKLQSILDSTIFAMAKIVEVKDPYTAGHQQRVSQLTEAISKHLDLDPDRIQGVCMSAYIHDIGKIYVPAEILSNPGVLTANEMNMIKMHPQHGADIITPIEFPWPVADIILQHHERMDGSGYPRGLSGDEILLEARILAVADVVEAMSFHRPFRPALGIDAALEEIADQSGTLYDREAAAACLDLFNNQGFKFQET